MKISQLLAVLKQQNVRLALDGERLLCYLPHDDYKLPAHLAGAIRDNKAELLTFLQSMKPGAAKLPPIKPNKNSATSYPLSSQQENLWFADQFEQGLDYSYNNAGTIHFDGKLNAAIIQQCFNDVIKRHQSLRTRFFTEQGKPRQAVNDEFSIELPLIQIDDESEVEALVVTHAQHLFDLASGQLLKMTLLRLSEVKHILAFNIHHIVSDGWSIRVLFQELKVLYSGYLNKEPALELPPLEIQYTDYASWQHQLKQQGGFETHLNYWEKQLKGSPQLLELATDHVRAPVQNHQGATITFSLPDGLKQQLNSLSIANGTSLFMTLLAGFKLLLWRYTGQADLLVGSPIANRGQKSLEDLIGFFVNTLVLRTQIDKSDTVASLLTKIKSTTLDA
ncbi:MAG: condensation domain-containing protein, partial [Psychrosphaera sp.]|nr:condensation domain-containing protein [Psychrosphaera sp.]